MDYKPVIESIDINLLQISNALKNITKTHPSKEIAIINIGGALPEIMNLTQEYPELQNVTWFSYWGSNYCKDSLESLGGIMSDIKMLNMFEGLAESKLVERMRAR